MLTARRSRAVLSLLVEIIQRRAKKSSMFRCFELCPNMRCNAGSVCSVCCNTWEPAPHISNILCGAILTVNTTRTPLCASCCTDHRRNVVVHRLVHVTDAVKRTKPCPLCVCTVVQSTSCCNSQPAASHLIAFHPSIRPCVQNQNVQSVSPIRFGLKPRPASKCCCWLGPPPGTPTCWRATGAAPAATCCTSTG